MCASCTSLNMKGSHGSKSMLLVKAISVACSAYKSESRISKSNGTRAKDKPGGTQCQEKEASPDLVKLMHYNLAMHTKQVQRAAVLDGLVARDLVALHAGLFQTLNTEAVQGAGNVDFTLEELEMNALFLQKVDTIFIYRGGLVNYMQTRQVTPVGHDASETVSCRKRSLCVDWVMQLCGQFGLSDDTLFLTVHVLDRFLSVQRVETKNLQLVTVACCLYAGRFAQCKVMPTACDLARKGRIDLTGPLISQTSSEIMQKVKGLPISAAYYLPLFLMKNSSNIVLFSLASYLLEWTLLDYGFCLQNPVVVCAASIMLARQLNCQTPWTAELELVSSYAAEELTSTAAEIFALHNSPGDSFLRIKCVHLKHRHSIVIEYLRECAMLESSPTPGINTLTSIVCRRQLSTDNGGIDTLPNSPAAKDS